MLGRAAGRGTERAFFLIDLPLGAFQVTDEEAVRNAIAWSRMRARRAVKLEGEDRWSRARARSRGRHPGHGPHRPDSADRHGAGWLQGPGSHRRQGAPAVRRCARAAGGRLLRHRAGGGACSRRRGDHRGPAHAHDRHRRRAGLRRPGPGLARPAGHQRARDAAFREAVRPRGRRHSCGPGTVRRRCAGSGAFPTEEHAYKIPAEELRLFRSEIEPGVLAGDDWL